MESTLGKIRTVNFINQESLARLLAFLRRNKFCVFELDGEGIRDADSFFAKAVSVFPQDPPLSGKCNWDAFNDSLWGGLDELGKERVAVVWTKAEKMLEYGLSDLSVALECFQQVAHGVATSEYGIPTPVLLLVFLVGEGSNFKLFEE